MCLFLHDLPKMEIFPKCWCSRYIKVIHILKTEDVILRRTDRQCRRQNQKESRACSFGPESGVMVGENRNSAWVTERWALEMEAYRRRGEVINSVEMSVEESKDEKNTRKSGSLRVFYKTHHKLCCSWQACASSVEIWGRTQLLSKIVTTGWMCAWVVVCLCVQLCFGRCVCTITHFMLK